MLDSALQEERDATQDQFQDGFYDAEVKEPQGEGQGAGNERGEQRGAAAQGTLTKTASGVPYNSAMKITLKDGIGEPVTILDSDSVNNGECDVCGEEKPSIEVRAVDGYDSVYACPGCLVKALSSHG